MNIEDVILSHSQRGMDILRGFVESGFCYRAANALYKLDRGVVLIATGFYVAGHAETDGPPGAYFLARALKKLGFSPVIVADEPLKGFFGDEVRALYLEKGFDADGVLDSLAPAALISVERCGENIRGDYANMRGVSIAEHTVELDALFDAAAKRGIYTVGIGDGGNEIGMGNVAEVISERLSLVPCRTCVDELIIATVSNWGAYALCAELSVLSGDRLFAEFDEVFAYLKFIVSLGSVDGVKKECVATVDGYDISVEKEIVDAVNDYILSRIGGAAE